MGLQAALGDTGSGTDGAAEPAAGGTAAPVGAGAAETEAVVAADRKAERAGSARAAAASTEPAAAGGEGSAGCSTESGFAAHTHWGPAVRKEESAEEEGELRSVTKVFCTHAKIIFKRKKIQRLAKQLTGNALEMPLPSYFPDNSKSHLCMTFIILGSNKKR